MKFVTLQDVALSCDSGTWGNEASDDVSSNPVLRSSNIHNFKLTLDDFAWREIPVRDLERKKLQNGDIIITASSGSPDLIGKCAFFSQPKDTCDYYFSNFTLRLRSDEEIIFPKFLFYWLISQQARSYLKGANDTTSGLRNLNKKIYLKQPVPLPPLPEQKRIAEVLDKADALREKRRLALQKLDTLLQSVFLEMFGDPVKNPKGWTVESLRNLIDESRPITYGILKPGDDIKDGVPYIRVLDMKDGEILVNNVRRTTPKIANEYKRSILKADDLLMSIRGHVGRLAIVPEVLEGANITQDTARLAPNEKCNVHYLHECLKSVYFQREMKRYVKGMAVQGINLGDVKELKIPIPTISLQEKFAAISQNFRKLRNEAVKSLKVNENLFQSLQQRAFKGELFNDEFPSTQPQDEKVWQTSLF